MSKKKKRYYITDLRDVYHCKLNDYTADSCFFWEGEGEGDEAVEYLTLNQFEE